MMMKWWAKRALKKAVTHHHECRTTPLCGMQQLKSVVVMAQYSDQAEARAFVAKLKQRQIFTQLWLFDLPRRGDFGSAAEPDVHYVERNQLRCGGYLPKRAVATQFLTTQADALFDLSRTSHLPLLYLVSSSKASLKMGMTKKTFNPYDIMIQSDKVLSLEELGENMLFYLDRIDMKNNNS